MMPPSARPYWYLSIGSGLAVGVLIGSAFIPFEQHYIEPPGGMKPIYGLLKFLVRDGAGFVFGACFAFCLGVARGIRVWRVSAFAVCIGVAHVLAWQFLFQLIELGLQFSPPSPKPAPIALGADVVFAFFWGAFFGAIVAGCAAFLFVSARSIKLFGLTVLVSGVAALSYPLLILFDPPFHTFFYSHAAEGVAVGFVYASVAIVLGWKLFQENSADR